MNPTGQADVLLVRHGKTKYTQEGLDITEEGIEETRKTAREMKDYLEGFDEIIVVSSPTARTQGTAKIFLEELGMNANVKLLRSIRTVDIYDLDKFTEYNVSHSGEVYGQMWFQDPNLEEKTEIMDGRSNVNKRSFRFLYHIGNFIKRRAEKGKKVCVIAFTHFEVGSNYVKALYPDVENFPQTNALGLGNSEAIVMSFSPDSDDIIIKAREKEGIISTNELSLNKEI
ncbi:MAG: phosphoglycerate mutase family protein [Candidatus Dojkabacteria bacterium]